METERIIVELSRLCRACGDERWHMFPLSARDPDGCLRLDDMLMACTDLKIHVGDGLPSSICYNCADELKTSYRFKQRCETTDRYFNELGLKSNEIKQEQETAVFKEGENENLLELKEEIDTNDNLNSLSFKEVTERISEGVEIGRETKQEQGDSLTITEAVVCKQEEDFLEVRKETEDYTVSVGNFENSSPNEDLCFEDFPHKKENRDVVSKTAENEEVPSGSKEEKEEETINDDSSVASSSSEDDDSDYFPKEELRKLSQLGHSERNIPGKYSSSSNLRIHKQTHESGGRKRFNCDVCGKSYSTTAYLRDHKWTHENGGRKRFQCDICAKSFVRSENLREHKLGHENGGRKRFKCDTCEKSYSWSYSLQKHKEMHENGRRKSFKCDVCGKSYSTTTYLRKHKQMHENGRRESFKCDVCEKSFAESSYLHKHKQTHQNSGRKRFQCDVCEKLFLWSKNLREHKLTHETGGRKRFECEVCEKSFATIWILREHKQRHENGGQKSFKCDICEKLFAESRYLRKHKKTHQNIILHEQK